ncbi:MAG TPA: hypothetical protein VH277_14980, partial [Gemmatimonadaceae bacterium]|nr:hypothetical protein [Gemmatimonadaceae bacterium]
HGILYAAYYNAGVRAIDVTGDLTQCPGATNVNTQANIPRCDLGAMGREVASALTDRAVYVWGVQYTGGNVYASDMLRGIWKLGAAR